MKEAWVNLTEADMRQMLVSLIGYTFGEEPEKRIPEIREGRKGFANMFIRMAEIKETDTVLDIGSGCGFGSYWLAGNAKEVHACDISRGYLSFAKKECQGLENIFFHVIENRSLEAIPDNSIDVAVGMSVFIHMNIYDIYWYFSELQKKLKIGGRVCFDFADLDNVDFSNRTDEKVAFFTQAAASYRADPDCLFALMQWNSEKSIHNVAENFGFGFVRREHDMLLFEKVRS